MNSSFVSFGSISVPLAAILLAICLFIPQRSLGQEHPSSGEAAIADSTNKTAQQDLQSMAQDAANRRGQVIQGLIKIVDDSNQNNLQRRYAAYYLGELRAAEAVDALSSQITLNHPGTLPGGSLDSSRHGIIILHFKHLNLLGALQFRP